MEGDPPIVKGSGLATGAFCGVDEASRPWLAAGVGGGRGRGGEEFVAVDRALAVMCRVRAMMAGNGGVGPDRRWKVLRKDNP